MSIELSVFWPFIVFTFLACFTNFMYLGGKGGSKFIYTFLGAMFGGIIITPIATILFIGALHTSWILFSALIFLFAFLIGEVAYNVGKNTND